MFVLHCHPYQLSKVLNSPIWVHKADFDMTWLMAIKLQPQIIDEEIRYILGTQSNKLISISPVVDFAVIGAVVWMEAADVVTEPTLPSVK